MQRMREADAGKIRILHVLLSLEIGGMEQVVAELVRNLDRGRFTPVVACIMSRGPLADELEREGIPVMLLERMTPVVSFLYPAPLVRAIRENRIDVVHAHSGCWHKAAIAARIGGVHNVIYTEHGRIFPDDRRVMVLDRIYSGLTRHVVVVSESLAGYMATVVGISEKKISVIINGVNVDRFETDAARVAGPLRIGIIARLAPVKDIGNLLRGMALVHRSHPEVTLSIVGDGPEREALNVLVSELEIGSVVEFHGFRRDIPEVLREMDIFALSSRSEGTSITLLEAMAAGKPVVVTDVGGNPAIIRHGINGLLIPSEDSKAMAEALLGIIENPKLRRDMGLANRARVSEQYDIRAMTRRYEALYAEGA